MDTSDLGTFSDVMFYLEQKGVGKDAARDIVTRVFMWGIAAAMDRLRPTRPLPADVPPVTPEQLSLIAEPPAPKPAKPPKPKQVARTFPEDFTLTEPLIVFAANRGFNPIETQRMWERFRDRNMAKGEKYADWNAAWRTWVNNQVEFRNRDGRGPGGRDPNKHDDRL
jgi:hypothetical protein